MRRTNKPLVKNETLFDEVNAIPVEELIYVGTKTWFTWLETHQGFVYEGNTGHFTARSELRKGIPYWYGHRRRDGKLTKAYLGKSEELTLERLEQACAVLAGQISPGILAGNAVSQDLGPSLDSRTSALMPYSGILAEMQYVSLTKFIPPALPQKLIRRPRLTQRINAPATLISAPSGFGKTTLLNEWKQSCNMPVAWVSLGTDDDHPQRFWSTVVSALQMIDATIGQDWLPQLRSSSPPSLHNTIINLSNDIVRVTEGIEGHRLCLVLDDFHHIHQLEIYSSMQTWLEQLPPRFQLVINSDIKLPFALGFLIGYIFSNLDIDVFIPSD
jgi:LuxR family maltose regulon positive regulatory protein